MFIGHTVNVLYSCDFVQKPIMQMDSYALFIYLFLFSMISLETMFKTFCIVNIWKKKEQVIMLWPIVSILKTTEQNLARLLLY